MENKTCNKNETLMVEDFTTLHFPDPVDGCSSDVMTLFIVCFVTENDAKYRIE